MELCGNEEAVTACRLERVGEDGIGVPRFGAPVVGEPGMRQEQDRMGASRQVRLVDAVITLALLVHRLGQLFRSGDFVLVRWLGTQFLACGQLLSIGRSELEL
jgi:hypothetical protein